MSSNLKIRRICQHCGHEFVAKTTVTKYCTDSCAKKAYKLRVKQQRMSASEAETALFRAVASPPKPDNYLEIKSIDYLTVKETAKMLKCDPRTIYNMVSIGRLEAINLSLRKIRILKKDIDSLFTDPINLEEVRNRNSDNKKRPPLKDCYSVGDILSEYKLSEKTLQHIIELYSIPKYPLGKYVYVSKELIDPILKNFNSFQQKL